MIPLLVASLLCAAPAPLTTTDAAGSKLTLRVEERTGKEDPAGVKADRELIVPVEGSVLITVTSPGLRSPLELRAKPGEAAVVPSGMSRKVRSDGMARFVVLSSTAVSRGDHPERAYVVSDAEAAANRFSLPRGQGAVTLLVQRHGDTLPAASWLELPPAAAVPEHAHPREEELLFIVSGEVEMSQGGKATRVGPGAFVHIPAKTLHQARVISTQPLRAVQFYSPGGPEQRFKPAQKEVR